MHHTDTSEILLRGVRSTLEAWAPKQGDHEVLYWVLRLQLAETGLADGATVADVTERIPAPVRSAAVEQFRAATEYFDDVRYAALEPITQVWGTLVNAARVAADSARATAVQKRVFAVPVETLVSFFRAARERMEVADELFHVFKAMPAPECQALAALLNVHVDARLDGETLCRLVRLLDHEGPMSAEEQADLQAISNTRLVHAAFTGLRANA